MKIILSLVSLFLFLQFSTAQELKIEDWCHSSHKMNELYANPAYIQQLNEDNLIRQAEKESPIIQPKGIIYKIPIVFHILHNGGSENVEVSQIMNALDVINRDFRAQNADTASVIAIFKPIIGDVEIEFVLATKAPNGECFRGYTRTQSSLTSQGDDGYAQVNAVRNGNDVYQGNWPSNKYLNVYVIADAGGAGGYTNYPSNFGGYDMSNGIWILHTQFGEIGTSSLSAGRSLTHECGHWLNLRHTWGNSNTPGIASNCSEDDLVTDTPNTRGAAGGCNLNENACGSIANTQNYMDYALSCQSMFTQGQVSRMRTAIQSSVGGRNNLWTAQNLIDTGADNNPVLCKANFSADRTSVCVGSTVTFTDNSYNYTNGWDWTFIGGTPLNSTSQNPVVTYTTPGLYEVKLTSTDGNSSDTEIKTSYIRVLPDGSALPFFEGFENFTTLSNIEEWEVKNDSGNAFELTTTTGLNSSKSARLRNYNQPEGTFDELVSVPVDLTSVTGSMTLSFRYAYKRRTSSDDDWLKVFVTNDCGQGWALRKSLHGQILSSEIVPSSFVPTSESDWTTIHMTNITSSYWVDNFRYKFQFEGGGGNNFYLDNINLYSGSPSDDIVALDELSEVSQLSVYPNPTEDELNIAFTTKYSANALISITSITGQNIQSHLIQAQEGTNLVLIDTNELESGVYFVQINVNGTSKTIQFIVK